MRVRNRNLACGLLLVLSLAVSVPASAHIGPPFPIIENQKVGPCVIALWTHPDIGTGAFYVMVDPKQSSEICSELKVKIGVQPESHRLPEAFYNAERDDVQGQIQYKAYADFDRDEWWRVHLVIESSKGNGEAFSRVEATPTALGQFSLLFYLFPFLAVAFLWYRGVSRTRKRRKKRVQEIQAPSGT